MGQSIGAGARHEVVRDKIRAIVTKTVAMQTGRSPMGVVYMCEGNADYDPGYAGFVRKGSSTCNARGEQGRFASECATKGGRRAVAKGSRGLAVSHGVRGKAREDRPQVERGCMSAHSSACRAMARGATASGRRVSAKSGEPTIAPRPTSRTVRRVCACLRSWARAEVGIVARIMA